ncbi:hypothetical protein BB558_001630 [Smittium angustum]|uniref:Uncharacterized protein n=1 Tax=Smittium angustum TaxID=133377 RepID=A0A2U1JAU0_SMIAN|nr:hypothetical protein BB558_001630 [Smittium angustum]
MKFKAQLQHNNILQKSCWKTTIDNSGHTDSSANSCTNEPCKGTYTTCCATSKDEFENEEEYNEHLTRPFSCSISMKNFIKFLYAHYIVPTSIVCIIIEQHAVIFTVYISSTAIGAHFEDQSNACGAMTYYIPAHLK